MRRIGGEIFGSVEQSNHFVFFDSLPLPLLIAPSCFGSFNVVVIWVLGWQWPWESSGSGMILLTIDMVRVSKEELGIHLTVVVYELLDKENN